MAIVKSSIGPSSSNINNRKLLEKIISVLNVAGPRESSIEGIYRKTYNKFDEMIHFVIMMTKI
jgi:hypothetical protein